MNIFLKILLWTWAILDIIVIIAVAYNWKYVYNVLRNEYDKAGKVFNENVVAVVFPLACIILGPPILVYYFLAGSKNSD